MENLTTELKTYQAKLPTLLGQQGKFVLIHDDVIDGIYESYSEAMTAGYKLLGIEKQFFVKKISPIDQVLYFTRDFSAACPA